MFLSVPFGHLKADLIDGVNIKKILTPSPQIPPKCRSDTKGVSLCFISQSSGDFRITQDNNSRICQIAALMDESIGKSPNDSEMKQRDTP